ncbi:TetR-like C-terminal domain-containing protein [Peterkaempfera sp. SMS 1(5)a]|uniref:TetR-like C-terminal domain-containing protein n=1 Tax=Peterkaempfera podocarpi TaxID=3232308 RepID=UPI003672AC2E
MTLPEPATGSLEGDLAEVGGTILGLYRPPVHRSWTDAMIASAVHDTDARRMLSEVIGSRIRRAPGPVAAAVRRGEAPAVTDAAEAVRMPAAPFHHRMYVSGEPLDDDLPRRAAAAAAAAVRAGALRSPDSGKAGRKG